MKTSEVTVPQVSTREPSVTVISGERDSATPMTIGAMLQRQIARIPDRPAFIAPGRAPLSYAALGDSIASVERVLHDFGLRREDRVALALPMGEDLALAFLAVTSAGFTCAPLNPAYRANEFEYYLADVDARAVIVPPGIESPVRDVAKKLGLRVIELNPRLDAAVLPDNPCRKQSSSAAGVKDIALVLHTSGTTSRPKMVPLTHANLFASARNVQNMLKLTESDRCLDLMPQFHIHGLMVMLASISAGGSVANPQRFDVTQFAAWLKELAPTWYSAVPTIQQAILARLQRNPIEHTRHALRFVRSCSAPLPPKVAAGLEAALGVPVIQAYGMTEAAHQIASNPLPPGIRKPGSVGRGTGVEVAIVDDCGRHLPPNASGEIQVRGANLVRGYWENPEANAAAFRDGWFRTGDQGFLDDDGYIFLSGRLKEMINRGGEKVWPQEVDDVLMDHPAVSQALAFALPHPTLGETVAAAVVLAEKASTTEAELIQFAAERLAEFKLPERIVFVDSIPRGPTGKLQRIGLAEKLGLGLSNGAGTEAGGSAPESLAPRTLLQMQLAHIWEEILDVRPIGVRDDFYALGGHSLLAFRMLEEVERACHQRLPASVLLEGATIEQLAQIITRATAEDFRRPITAIQTNGARLPLFYLHGDWAGGGHYCIGLARDLGPDQPFYAVHPHGHDDRPVPSTIEAMAAEHLEAIRSVRPRGPYLLGGYCNGALMAYEIACRLREMGEDVPLVVLIEVNSTNARPEFQMLARVIDRVAAASRMSDEQRRELFTRLGALLLGFENRFEPWIDLAKGGLAAQTEYARRKMHGALRRLRSALGYGDVDNGAQRKAAPLPAPFGVPEGRFAEIDRIYLRAIASYIQPHYPGQVLILQSAERGAKGFDQAWGRLTKHVRVEIVPGTHTGIITGDAQDLVQRLRRYL